MAGQKGREQEDKRIKFTPSLSRGLKIKEEMAYTMVKGNKRLEREFRNDLMERLFSFSVDVIIFLRNIPDGPEARVIKHQLIKAATSGGANYEESQAGISKREFKNKVAISLKEIREANYWLRIILKTELIKDGQLPGLIKESNELKAILGSIVSKLRKEFQ